ncbi:MerR family DNA-binding transcriptional regulator [Adlercreutzia sp. R7]|uniref:MerR family DNA-binding transcriptional regulator n=1 Tax=Adlercreutzia wanghongyangiae TaxID=3111451 RepID=A0ABU6IF06_9ACTN|nr:MerR family DNA-binding transcriptional regulator [Adlercreutzia sp. R7]
MKRESDSAGMLSIGQVAKLYGISHDALRLYDKKGLLKPIVNPETGYRSYTLEHLSILDMIMVGRKTGIPLARMQRCFASPNAAEHAKLLSEQRAAVQEQIRELQHIEQHLNELCPLVEDAIRNPNGRAFTLERNIFLECVTVADLLSTDVAESLAERDEFLLFGPDTSGEFHEDETRAFYPLAPGHTGHEPAAVIKKGTRCHTFQGTLDAIRHRVTTLRKGAKQPVFVRFDYCLPASDQDHHYLCTIFA